MTGLPIYLTALAVSFGLGAPLAMGLLGHRRSAWLVAPALGYSVLAVAATLLYRAGLPMLFISALAACLAAIGFAWTAWRYRTALRHSRQTILLWIFVVIGAVAWVWLPMFTGGAQFSVFQGNHWDHFNYTTAGVIYSRLDYPQVIGAAEADFLRNPLLPVAASFIHARPAVMLLFAAFGRIAPGQEMYLSGYAFESVLVVAEFMAALYVLLNLCSVTTRRDFGLAIAAAAAFAFGFWGQYILDINAWSQQAVVAPLLVAFACIVIPLRPEIRAANLESFAGSRSNEAIALALAGTGALYLYPEGTFFFGAMVFTFLCYIGLFERRPALRGAITPIALATIAALLAGVLAYDGIYTFLQDQANFAAAQPVAWWKYYQAFLFGRAHQLSAIVMGSLSAQLEEAQGIGAAIRAIGDFHSVALALFWVNLGAGILGLYFLTPAHAANWMPALALSVFIVGFGVALVAAVRQVGISSAFGNLAMFALTGILGALMLAGSGRFWVAGKALAFTAPYFCLALGVGLIASMQPRKKHWYVAITLGIWMLAQLGFAATRPIDAASATGIHRTSPYPSTQDLSFKSNYRWDIAELLEKSEACNLIRLDIPFAWMRHYVALALFERGQRYWYQFPVNTYYGGGRDIGQMALGRGKVDCAVAVVDHRVQLTSGPPIRR